jgi:toxin HigB-1
MDIGFDNTDLEDLCKIDRIAKRKLGAPCAKQLHNRIADIQAASVVTDLIAGKPHPLERERTDQFAVTLVGLIRLTFESANHPIPKTADDKVDWSKVTKVTIVYIGDYHDY